jgi:hypothetical protein
MTPKVNSKTALVPAEHMKMNQTLDGRLAGTLGASNPAESQWRSLIDAMLRIA